MPATYHDALVDAQARKLLRLSPAMRQRLTDRFYDGDPERKKKVTDRIAQLESGDDPAHYRNPGSLMDELETLDTSDDPGDPAAAAGASAAAGAKKITKGQALLRKALMGEDEGALDELLEEVAKSGTSAGARKGWATRRGHSGGGTSANAIAAARARQTVATPKTKVKAESTRHRATTKLDNVTEDAARSARARRALKGSSGKTAVAVRRDYKGDQEELAAAKAGAKKAFSGNRAAAKASNEAGYRAVRAAGAARRKRGAKITAGKAKAAQVRTVRRDMAASRNSDAVAALHATGKAKRAATAANDDAALREKARKARVSRKRSARKKSAAARNAGAAAMRASLLANMR